MNQKKSINRGLIYIVFCLLGFNLVGIATADDSRVCYWDWTWHSTDHIGTIYKASAGYTYMIVDLYLKNDADTSISTLPILWKLTIDKIQYDYDGTISDPSIITTAVDVIKGGELETKIVYEVKGNPTSGSLSYTKPHYDPKINSVVIGPTLQRVSHTFA